MDILDCDDSPSDKVNPLNIVLFGSKTAVCYVKVIQGKDFYICYDRPPPIVYNSDYNIYESQSPLDDPVPQQLQPLVQNACSSYQTTTSRLFKTFADTKGTKEKVDSGVTAMETVRANIQGVYNQYCSPTMPAGLKKQQCDIIAGFLGNSTITTNINTLKDIQSTLATALTNLQAYYTNDIQRGFNGFGCLEPNVTKPAGLN